ncbi:MAG TPA: class I SAM-dependent methyltransferase [Xanthobacteraceae bacterium]|jgi:SAM-dependent methyltransferase|nr:class I SAM-dependent methyltransferase [Xanthobacteraceae bacterium]
MRFTQSDITTLYQSEATKHGLGGTSTIQDQRTRDLEIDAIASYLSAGQRVLDVGCGNGYSAAELAKRFPLTIEAFDLSEPMIELAQQQVISPASKVTFGVGDILKYQTTKPYNVVYSERCVQNLLTWDDQKVGLTKIRDALEPGGVYVMDECFWTGLNNLNEARAELDLPPIPESWHNNFFDEQKTIEFMDSIGMKHVGQNCFLSGYYFGSRVLLPGMLADPKKAKSNSRLNDYFCALPPAGDFAPMKIVLFERQ